jgi:FkbM family methyltransferase
LSRMFRNVEAFEPVDRHIACFLQNLTSVSNVHLFEVALGPRAGKVQLHTGPSSSGDTYVKLDGEHEAEMQTLDHFGLVSVDFVKIDCEGYEYFILQGAERTIREQKPFVIVEQKPGKGKQFDLPDTAACTLLESWGATRVFEYSGDYGYLFK